MLTNFFGYFLQSAKFASFEIAADLGNLLVAHPENNRLGDAGKGQGLHVDAVLLHVREPEFGIGILVRIGVLPRLAFFPVCSLDFFTDGS